MPYDISVIWQKGVTQHTSFMPAPFLHPGHYALFQSFVPTMGKSDPLISVHWTWIRTQDHAVPTTRELHTSSEKRKLNQEKKQKQKQKTWAIPHIKYWNTWVLNLNGWKKWSAVMNSLDERKISKINVFFFCIISGKLMRKYFSFSNTAFQHQEASLRTVQRAQLLFSWVPTSKARGFQDGWYSSFEISFLWRYLVIKKIPTGRMQMRTNYSKTRK